MQRRLPPLNALRAFEVAARLESFSLAAEALHVTHGAVSRQIRLLEEWLGRPLFERRNRKVVLTRAGADYLTEIAAAFDRITLATAAQLAARDQHLLRVNASSTFALRWLIPRLARFQQAHPEIRLQLANANGRPETLIADCDLVIAGGPRRIAGLTGQEFLAEARLPVCSPQLLARLPLRKPADLSRHTLLHCASQPDMWPLWLAEAGVPDLQPAHALTLEHFYLTLQAAQDGLGVAMGPMVLVAEDLAAGRLVAPLKGPRLSHWRYFSYVARNRAAEPAILALREWLVEEGEASASGEGS
ncbi:transcriptional regulator GcvA [Niveibacterium sp. SC-1]|uniref:transcriptional regulator GcvA n=1 Tax=Niveibacterium sp. SC-1 TaxID=3135646 RepID=UPI00311F1706